MAEKYTTILVIPDTQVKPGVPVDHLEWIGRYMVDKYYGRSDFICVQLGDFWDMPSLSSYDRGKKAMEGRRVIQDIEAGNYGLEVLDQALTERNAIAKRQHKWQWHPKRYLLRGNHEDRLQRAIDSDAQLDGLLSFDSLLSPGWEVVPYLEILHIDGVAFSHYFYNPSTGRPYGGSIENRMRQIGVSFVQGHQQVLLHGTRYTAAGPQHGIVAGAAYAHEESYLGPQGNSHWRGIVVLNQVHNGDFDPMFVSLDYLARKYGHADGLADYQWRNIA